MIALFYWDFYFFGWINNLSDTSLSLAFAFPGDYNGDTVLHMYVIYCNDNIDLSIFFY